MQINCLKLWLFGHCKSNGEQCGEGHRENSLCVISLIRDNLIGGHSIEFCVWHSINYKHLIICCGSIWELGTLVTKYEVRFSFGSSKRVWVEF